MGVDEDVERSVNETRRLMGILADMKKRSAEIVGRKNEWLRSTGADPAELETVYETKRDQLPENTREDLDNRIAAFESELERECQEAAERFRKDVLLKAEQMKKAGGRRVRNMI